jgi:hypothetical protein
LQGVRTALNVEKGMDLLKSLVAPSVNGSAHGAAEA